MPDFYQHKLISTLHQLGDPDLEERQAMLVECAVKRPISLILPALYSEVKSPALALILEHLSEVNYAHEIIFSMNRMTAEEFKHAREFIGSRLPESQKHAIIWNDGPRVSALYGELAETQLTTYSPGKGYNVWMAMGYILARGETRVVATHDSDILSYHRDMLWRLCLPTSHPNLGYDYCKSYYGRVSDRMYGRVTRLFVMPLLRAMMRTIGQHPLLEYLEGFRYPLSGEFSMNVELAKVIRVPGDWGLEIGMLCEVFRNTTMRRVCQVDLGSNFEHKHQHLGTGPTESDLDPNKGLMKMARDIALTLLSNLSADGVVLSRSILKPIRITYDRMAKEIIQRYYADALVNGLKYFRHEEAEAVEAFSHALDAAAKEFDSADYVSPQIPNWNRVYSALPDFGKKLTDAVEADMGR